MKGNGIWCGNGFDSQFIIAYEANRREINANCGDRFGYIVKQNKPEFIKIVGIEEKEEEYEYIANVLQAPKYHHY